MRPSYHIYIGGRAMIFAAITFFVAAIAFAVVNIHDIIEVIRSGGPDYEDD